MIDPQVTSLMMGFVGGLQDCAVIGLDAGGHVVAWNEGARLMLGHPDRDIVGHHVSCLYPDPQRASAALEAARAEGRHEERGLRVRRDGAEIMARSVLMAVRDPAGSLLGFGTLLVPEAAPEPVPGALPGPAAQAAAGGSVPALRERILMVDDDEGVRDVTARRLASLGYSVISAANASEALAALVDDPEIDLLLTDVVMPGDLHGAELAREARILRPGLKILFTSGYLEEALIRNQALESGTAFLIKPFNKAELAAKLRDVLGPGSAGRSGGGGGGGR